MNNFYNNIKILREKKGWSKTELANRLKVSQSTITRWENGEMGITIDNAYSLSKIFDVPLQNLVGNDVQFDSSDTYPEYELADNDHNEFKQILKDKNLMDTQENIDLSRLQEMLDLADKVEQLTKRDDN